MPIQEIHGSTRQPGRPPGTPERLPRHEIAGHDIVIESPGTPANSSTRQLRSASPGSFADSTPGGVMEGASPVPGPVLVPMGGLNLGGFRSAGVSPAGP